MASVTQSGRTDGKTYADVIQEMKNAGIKTTRIKQGKEADFEDYGSALSSEVKHMLMDSFDCDQDYVLQQQLAGLFANSHDVKNGDFMKACKKMGLTVTRQSVKTSYISDYKGGNKSNSVRNGHISVFTISDGKGGEIKIADTNGNGAIESEELFMNQLLGDINLDLQGITPITVGGSGDSASGGNSLLEGINEVTQDDFNRKVEEHIKSGETKAEAELSAGIELNALTMTYTGTMQDATEKVNQTEYNNKVENYIQNGYSTILAESAVNVDLGTNNFKYTGSMEEKEDAIGQVKDNKNSKTKKASENNKGSISQKDYNDEIENKLQNGKNVTDAIKETKKELNVFNLSYSGFNNEIIEEDKKEKEENIFLLS
ncbi:hypothetical protein IJ182_09585 [bacterium]|nr:hypothetical protein [bacterium]